MSNNDPQTGLRGRPKDPAKRQAILDAGGVIRELTPEQRQQWQTTD